MSGITQGYTRDEIRGFVHEYYLQPHGKRKAWLDSKSLTVWTFRQWRTMVFEGDLDRTLVPRDDGGMTRKNGERSAFEKMRAREIAEHQSDISKLEKRIAELEGTNEALGKAIGLLHELSVPEPETKQANDPKSS
ncbi:hypothetical protein ACQCSX_16960 [Pseudarthrobacter sp. P1]|uniref:hypothetical protein n=1 Tax=Pseudarthrobacter sp. P1 TaxID=3418418 RepID=UPI003CF20BAB